MVDARDQQRSDNALKICAHRDWLVTQTEHAHSLTSPQYAKWRATLRTLEAEQRRLVP
jgi:hypothetical protein